MSIQSKKLILSYIFATTVKQKSYLILIGTGLIISILDSRLSMILVMQGCDAVDAIRFDNADKLGPLRRLSISLFKHYLISGFGKFLSEFLEIKYNRDYLNDAVSSTMEYDNNEFHLTGTGKIQESIIRGSDTLAEATIILVCKIPDLIIFWMIITYKLSKLCNYFTATVLLTGLTLASIFGFVIGRYIDKNEQAILNMFNSKIFILTDILNNFDVIKSFNKESVETTKYRRSLKNVTRQTHQYNFIKEFLKVLQKITTIAPHLIVLYFIITTPNRCMFDLEQVSAYNAIYMKYRTNFTDIRDKLFDIIKKTSYGDWIKRSRRSGFKGETIQKSISTNDTINKIDDTNAETLPSDNYMVTFNDKITLQDVALYAGNTIIQTNINVTINKGDLVAIVGQNGTGKSSFVKSILRFSKTEGEFRIDGTPIEDFKIQSLREVISYVPQDSHIFNDSVFNNLAFSQNKPSPEEIYRLCKKYNYHTFFSQLQNGYETWTGENGKFLSGGQRQRINFMRAVIKGAPIMVLDEPTSALDRDSEMELVDNLTMLNKSGVTVIMIVHNISLLPKFSKIIHFTNKKIYQLDSFNAWSEAKARSEF